MKKKTIRVLSLILAILFALPLAACGEDTATTPKKTTQKPSVDETPERLHDLSKYSVVHPIYASDVVIDGATEISNFIFDGTGVKAKVNIDKITDPEAKEILVGDTNRPESAEVAALLTDDDTFIIKTIGEKIVIASKSDTLLLAAMNYFVKLSKENGFGFDSEIDYVSEKVDKLTVVADGKSEFNIVYLAGLLTSGGTEGKCELEVQLGRDLAEKLKTKFSVEVPVVDGSVKTKFEILIGETGRSESDKFIDALAHNEYGFEVMGDKIAISGTNATTTRLAVELFMDFVDSMESEELSLYDGARLTRRIGTWNTDIPTFEGGTYAGNHDGGHGAFALAYTDTTKSAFDDYCDKLEEEGYVLWKEYKIERNYYATYTHETRGMIHVYFTDSEKTVRIISYMDGTYNLPTYTEPYTYKKVTDTKISGYGLSAGMCFVVTLEDGSFIVIDSGTSNTASSFYQFLQSLNKRNDGKIVIRAWYLTHEHSDHFYMFQHFMKQYGSKVTVEEFWCNPATVDYTHYGDNRNVMWDECYDEYKKYVEGDFKWITLHTGMEFYMANMKFEVLYTEEDIFPRRTLSYNDMILVMKMTDTSSGQTTLWLGDLMKVGCQVLTNNYTRYLDCDIVQVAHHGMSEALELYKEVTPTVALWATTTAKRIVNDEVKGGIYKPTTKYLDENVPTNIYANGVYTITLPFKTGDEVVEWKK